MAAHEEQDQRVVLSLGDAGVAARARRARPAVRCDDDVRFAAAPRAVAAQVIGHAPRRRPGSASRAGCRARPRRGHCTRRREQRLLHGVLRGGEIAEAPDRPRRAPAARARAAGARPEASRRRWHHMSAGGALITCAHFDRHVQRHAALAGRRRRARGDRVRALGALDSRRSSSRRGTPWLRRTARR